MVLFLSIYRSVWPLLYVFTKGNFFVLFYFIYFFYCNTYLYSAWKENKLTT